jgi:Zn-dependent protease with chaperone function
MNFFQQQEKARVKTKYLLICFLLGLAGTVLSVYLVIMLFLFNQRFQKGWWDEEVFMPVAAITTLIICVGSLVKLGQLSSGGRAVAQALGGEMVNPNTHNFEEKRLLNVVNEMAIASGIPAPEVYVLPDDGINAFAAGKTTADASIGITRGALKHLNRDELQGVIAHEFSHILNGDMRLNTNLIAAISGILTISTIGYYILRLRTRGKNSGQIKIIGLALLLVGICGAFFARIIQAAISRQREYLADASAVQFTRNPSGIAGALKKIANLIYGSAVSSPTVSETAHLFFSNPFSGFFASLFATHPPIEERIKAIEGISSFETETEIQLQPTTPDAKTQLSPQKFRAETVVALAGTVSKENLANAERLISSYPQEITRATENSFSSTALIFALLLNKDNSLREKQLKEVSEIISPALLSEVKKMFLIIKDISPQTILPVIQLSINGLKGMSPQQYFVFKKALDTLIRSDNQIDLFEFMITKIVKRNLEPQYSKVQVVEPIYSSFDNVRQDCRILLSAVAWCGTSDSESAQKAFNNGMRILGFYNENLLPLNQCNIAAIDNALDNCLLLKPTLRGKLLNACANVASDDGYITEYEAELVRAIADALECPIPLFALGQ